MSMVEPGAAGAGLVARVKDILTKPSATWDVIDRERPAVGQLYTSYIAPLAAIPAVCGAVGMAVIGVTEKLSPMGAVTQAVTSFVLSLVMVYVVALIIDGLAPSFGGQKDRIQALKVAAYASTASWVAGVFSLLPTLAVVGLLGALYSLFLLYKGLPKLMKAPEEKALSYTAVVVVVAIVLGLVIGMVTGAVTGAVTGLTGGRGAFGGAEISGAVKVPGVGEVDIAKLEAMGKALEKGEPGPVADPETLKGYLPTGFAGFTRGDVSTGAGGMGAIQGSQAEAVYSRDDARITLEVTDAGGAAALVGLAGAFNARSSKETATGYEKMGQVDGRMTQERYDREARSGEYGVLVGERFWVRANGDGVSMDELKAAVAAVGIGRLEAAAKAN